MPYESAQHGASCPRSAAMIRARMRHVRNGDNGFGSSKGMCAWGLHGLLAAAHTRYNIHAKTWKSDMGHHACRVREIDFIWSERLISLLDNPVEAKQNGNNE